MSVFVSRRLRQQPWHRARIDWGLPLTQGLVAAVPAFNKGGASSQYEAVQGRAVVNEDPTQPQYWYEVTKSSPHLGALVGGYAGFDNVTFQFPDVSSAITASGEVTVLVVCRSRGTDALGNNGPWSLQPAGDAFHYPYSDGNAYIGTFHASRWVNGVAIPGISDPHVAVITSKNGAQAFYTHGKLRASGSIAAAPSVSGGKDLGGTAGEIFALYAWNRVLSSAEVTVISENPWQIFSLAPRRFFIPKKPLTYSGGLFLSRRWRRQPQTPPPRVDPEYARGLRFLVYGAAGRSDRLYNNITDSDTIANYTAISNGTASPGYHVIKSTKAGTGQCLWAVNQSAEPFTALIVARRLESVQTDGSRGTVATTFGGSNGMNLGNGFGAAGDKDKPRSADADAMWINGEKFTSLNPVSKALNNGEWYVIANDYASYTSTGTVFFDDTWGGEVEVALFAAWKGRRLTDSQHVALGANPWQLFAPLVTRIYSIPSKWMSGRFDVKVSAGARPPAGSPMTVNMGLEAVTADVIFDVELTEGATVKDSWTESVSSAAGAVVRQHTVSSTVVDSITDFTDIHIRGTAKAP